MKWTEWSARLAKKRKLAHDTLAPITEQLSLTTTAAGTPDGFMETTASDIAGESAPALNIGEKAGNWRVEAPLGEGGMGAVYRVHRDDGQFSQRAALKLVKSDHEGLRSRFIIERERLAVLEHAGISRVIDGGETASGLPFMVVEYVDGEPINAYAAGRSLSRSDRVILIRQLTEALAYAHRNLILHRDIKPANVLVDEKSSIRLIDFGVAALVGDEASETAGPLTIAYAAPESIEAGPPTVSLDIFSTGVLLYELLVGALPDRLPDGGLIIEREVIRDADLEAIVRKATATKPSARYTSIDALAEDLDAYLAGRAVSARQGGVLYHFVKGVRRYPIASFISALFLTSLVGGLIITANLADKAKKEAERAALAQSQAEYALGEAELNFRVQEAYGDALHRMFGGEGNTDRMTETLLSRAHEAQLYARDDPDHAAEITYAIGRNFIERNDYRTAIDVLGPWVEQGYGDGRLLVRGKLYLGLAHRYQGSYEQATPLLREAIAYYAKGPDHGGFEHILGLITLAGATGEDALLDETSRLAEAAMRKDESAENKIFYLNVLAMLAASDRDFEKSTLHNREIISILDANPLLEIAGQDVVRINRAMTETFHAHDYEAALKELEITEALLTKDKGESLSLAYIYDIRGVIAALRGDFNRALSNHQRAVEIALRFGGEGSDIHGYTGASHIESLVMAGRIDEAEAAAETLELALTKNFHGQHTRFILAKAALIQAREDSDAASRWLSSKSMGAEAATRNVNAKFRYEQLEERGVTFVD